MKSSFILASLAAFISQCRAVGVVGAASGFAAGTTGDGSATPQYPKDITELKTWLTDSVARVIVLNKEYATSSRLEDRRSDRGADTTSLAARELSPRTAAGQPTTSVLAQVAKTPLTMHHGKLLKCT